MSAGLPVGSIVDVGDLLNVAWTSVLAGLGVTSVYAFAILGATRAVDLSRQGRRGGGVLFGVLGLVALLGVGFAVVFGIVVLTNK